MSDNGRTLIGRECRFAVHLPSNHPDVDDLHYVKEQITFKEADGTIKQVPNVRLEKNFKRPVWFTTKNKQLHLQKKEWEDLDNLQRKDCTQSELRNVIARHLDKGWSKDHLKKLLSSPYVYGADISSTSLLKKELYMNKWPDLVTPFNRCIYDTETDVVHGHEEIILATVVFKDEILTCATQAYVDGLDNVQGRLDTAISRYVGDVVTKRNMKIRFVVCKDVVELVRTIFKQVHEWKPDWLAIWNIKFDIPKTILMLEKYGVDPAEVLCDPKLPPELRVCKFMPGQDKQITASGKVKPINPAAQWHTFKCTASYYAIDAMCVYKHLRLGEQEESSYGLDAIMKKHLDKRGKLEFAEADHIQGKLAWHQFMQAKFKIEYIVYNIWDCLGMLELDDKIKDLAFTLPSFSVTTDFSYFKSNPRKIMDQLHFYALENNCVMGTVGYQERVEVLEMDNEEDDKDSEEDDEEENTALLFDEDGVEDEEDENGRVNIREPKTLDLTGWISTLPSHMSVLGLPLIEEDTSLSTNFRTHVYDSDEVAAYPTATEVANVSKASTKREIIGMKGIKETVFRMQNMNLLLGPVNGIEYSTTMFNFPKPEDLLLQFQAEHI